MARPALVAATPALWWLALALSLSAGNGALAHAATADDDTLSFEIRDPIGGGSAGWGGGPAVTLFRDSVVVHGGRWAARIERGAAAERDFSSITRDLPVTFAGDSIVLSGWIRTEGVEGWAGLWMREDGRGGAVQFAGMHDRGISGTTPWTEYRLRLPLDRKARTFVFGALLTGRGTIWADDLRLTVDGKPLAEAPAAVRESTAMDRDHEFDAGSQVPSGGPRRSRSIPSRRATRARS